MTLENFANNLFFKTFLCFDEYINRNRWQMFTTKICTIYE